MEEDKIAFNRLKSDYHRQADKLCLADPFLFKRGTIYFKIEGAIRKIQMDIDMNCLSYTGGMDILKEKISIINYQYQMVLFNKIISNKIATDIYDDERSAERYKLYSKIIGFLAGIGQVSTGIAICSIPSGISCLPGTIMALHGLNNIYENGYYLLFYKEKSGPIREAYHYGAHTLGIDKRYGDVAYGTIDLALSGYGLARRIPTTREKSWNLFGIKSHQTDYTRGINSMTPPIFTLEIVSDEITILSLYPQITETPDNAR